MRPHRLTASPNTSNFNEQYNYIGHQDSSPMSCTPLPTPIPQPHNPQTITLTTSRLLLRAGFPSDAPALHIIFSNPDVMRYWDTLPHASLIQTTDWLAKMLASPQNGVTEFVICLRPTASTSAS